VRSHDPCQHVAVEACSIWDWSRKRVLHRLTCEGGSFTPVDTFSVTCECNEDAKWVIITSGKVDYPFLLDSETPSAAAFEPESTIVSVGVSLDTLQNPKIKPMNPLRMLIRIASRATLASIQLVYHLRQEGKRLWLVQGPPRGCFQLTPQSHVHVLTFTLVPLESGNLLLPELVVDVDGDPGKPLIFEKGEQITSVLVEEPLSILSKTFLV